MDLPRYFFFWQFQKCQYDLDCGFFARFLLCLKKMSFRSPQSQKKRCKRGRWSLSSVRLQLLSQWAPSRQQQSATRWHIHDTRKSRITRKRGRSSSPNHHLRYLTTNSVKEAKQTTGETQDHISSVRPISFFFFYKYLRNLKSGHSTIFGKTSPFVQPFVWLKWNSSIPV